MKQNYILCPVCGKHKFPAWEDNGTCICPHCGWEHSINDEENPFELSGPNELCLNDYQLRYEYYVEQNPEYHWARDECPELPNIEPIMCPVCKKYHFEEMTIEDVCCGVLPSDVSCRLCGWHYDEKQQDDASLKYGANEMSLNEYRVWYNKKLEESPNYCYFDEQTDNYIPTPHLCPVCGKYEFYDESSNDICPYCGWEDDAVMESEPDKWEGCANDLCLNDYKKRYDSYLEMHPNYKFSKDGQI